MTEAKKVAAKRSRRRARPPRPSPAGGRQTGPLEHRRHRRLGREPPRARRHHPRSRQLVDNETGGWRTNVPTIDPAKCTGCMLCYFYCPDAAIVIENDIATGVDLAHCKGCGICAVECPVSAITMSVEEKE